MSQFLTDKYLKYRAALESGPIEADLACEGCGYNLRGLRFGRLCPECGVPIQYRRKKDLALHEMPLDLIRAFRSSAWMASLAMAGVIVLALGGVKLIKYSNIAATLVLFLTSLWIFAIVRLTPALAQPQAAARGFSPKGRLRLAARWLQLAWLFLVIPGATMAWTGIGGISPAVAMMTGFAWLVGMAGVLCLALLLARLAAWAGDEFAEKAFNISVFGSAFGCAILFIIPFLAFLIGNFAFIVAVAGLAIVVLSMMAFPVGLLALSRSVNWSVVHAEERLDRSRAMAARIVRHVDRQPAPVRSAPIPLADPVDSLPGETNP